MLDHLEARTLHFDLSIYPADTEFTLMAGDAGRHVLNRYADHPSKMDEHRARNAALGLIPEAQSKLLTHFVEDAPMARLKPAIRRVVFPSLDDHPLPEIAMLFPHVPDGHIRAAHHRFWRDERAPHSAELARLGVEEDHFLSLAYASRRSGHSDLHLGAAAINSVLGTAQAIALYHPELGNITPGVMEYLKASYLNPLINSDMSDFVQYLQQTSPGVGTFTWYNKAWAMWSKDPTGAGTEFVPAELDTSLKTKSGPIDPKDWPDAPGQGYKGMPSYNLTDEFDPPAGNPTNASVIAAASPTVQTALLATKTDRKMDGILWNRQNGVTATSARPATVLNAPGPKAAGGGAMALDLAATTAKGFSVKQQTSAYGLYLYDLAYDATKAQLTFPVKNWPSRYLGAYVQFFKEDGTVIKRADIPNWPDLLPVQFVKGLMEASDSKNYLTYISSGTAIFGAPVPPLTQTTNLSFPWPQEASRALVLLGGLGCAAGFADWDTDVDLVGVLATGIINYGVGGIMLVANVYVINPLIEFLKSEWGIGFFAICGFIGAGGLATGVATRDTSAGKKILSQLAGISTSVIFGALSQRAIMAGAKLFVEKFTEKTAEMVAEMTAEELLEEVPVAGWALRVASIAADLAGLAATTIECVLSPATYSLEILHSMDLSVTIRPDPTHATTGFDPVWPAIADHWMVQVRYPSVNGNEGGTTYTQVGPMPTSIAPISVSFPGIPAGGKIEVIAQVFSASDWVAGRWTSGWVDASPDANDHMALAGAIVEILVPLTADTTYSQKKTLGYSDAENHYWQISAFTAASALVPDLDTQTKPSAAVAKAFADNGNLLSAQAGISVVTQMAAWQISDPVTGDSFDLKARQVVAAKLFTVDTATHSGGLDGGGAPSPALSGAFDNAQYPLPSGAQVTVVTKGSNWTIAAPGELPDFALTVDGSSIRVDQASWIMDVQNTARPAPSLPPEFPLVAQPGGNTLGGLGNIIHNNHSFQLGYSYLASGQNIPVDDKPGPVNTPIYAMQSISTLATPQAQIFVPAKGYSQPCFLAYDQFGLTPLFPLDGKYAATLTDGPVPADVASDFAAFGHKLPATAIVKVIAAGKDWAVGLPGADPSFELRLSSIDLNGKQTSQIDVFDWPVPGLDNFFLEPQPNSPQGTLTFYLKGVDFDQGPGEYTFDTGATRIWGIFSNSSPFQEVAIHPNGYAVALDNKNAKLFVAKLPATAGDPGDAFIAMPLSGKGNLQGLMDAPQAMTITADGRILVLETGTTYIDAPRIQAFDVKGNRVPSFSVGQPSFTIINGAPAIITELDQREVSDGLLALFQKNITPSSQPKAVVPDDKVAAVAAALDGGAADQSLVDVLTHYGLATSKNKPADYKVTITEAGKLWYVADTTNSAVYDVRVADQHSGSTLIDIYMRFGLAITLRSVGAAWQIEDSVNAMTFSVTKSRTTTDLLVEQLSSFMPLRAEQVTGALSYLDIASETKGYIYVLSVVDNGYNASHKPEDLTFRLDIYSPNGAPLLAKPQPGLVAGRITVDQYRSLYSLNYNPIIGPNTRTEPGVTQWIPTAPAPAS